MVKITRITTQKNNSERFSIFIDEGNGEEFGFGVDQDVLIRFGLRKGIELNQETLDEIQFEDHIKKGFNLALHYLSYRMRSEKEIIDHLATKEIEEAAFSSIISKLKRYGYVNDLEFARAFVRTKVNAGGKGPYIIHQELIQKGVSQDTIEKALEEYPYERQFERAEEFALKKVKKLKNVSSTELKQKLGQALTSKGFEREIIQEVMNEIDHKNHEEEWEALLLQAQKAERRFSKLDSKEYKYKMKQFLYRKGFPFSLINHYLEEFIDQ
ncbi:recombination regulator RecX [Alkalihalobacillus sp. CinArs1]|uniref:recombination regulator RecX n=1 Tax=Alkalihalobacillus sp. CinArs1 TaxID=2995314 RepID=UPI0022DE4977|nr:recombination regulator RecX [Alkalihalobacillus sp. CinArs1]